AGHEHGRGRQSRGFKATNSELARRRRHDGPSIGRKRSEERLGAFDRLDALHILDLGKQERVNLGLGIDARQFKLGDRFDRAYAVNGRKEGGDIETMPPRPSGPYALGRGDGVENRAVHVEQQRAKGAVRKRTLALGGSVPRRPPASNSAGTQSARPMRISRTWRSVIIA